MIDESLTTGTQRILQAAERFARARGDAAAGPLHVLWALRSDPDCRPSQILADHGLDPDRIAADIPAASEPGEGNPAGLPAAVLSSAARRAIQEAQRQGRARDRNLPAGTEHLLLGLAAVDADLAALLAAHGLDREHLGAVLDDRSGGGAGPVPVDFETLELLDASAAFDVRRILDASINRAREGLRVVEDYTRFGLDDAALTAQLKSLRHRLTQALEPIPAASLVEARATEHDVGTAIRTSSEFQRGGPFEAALANLKRTEEALRTIEEFGKIEFPLLAHDVEQIRYELYTVERTVFSIRRGRDRLAGVQLYVLVSEAACTHPWDWTIRELLAGGAQAIQMREKDLSDLELIRRARRLRALTRQAGALFIVNDRPDLARLADADGVHLGQDDLTVKDARKILGTGFLVGVSTHSPEQAAAAVRSGADYLGVGPIFASRTKSFPALAGLDLIARTARELSLPMFAIGGIAADNLAAVLERGATRVAVSAAVLAADDPRSACAELRRGLAKSTQGDA